MLITHYPEQVLITQYPENVLITHDPEHVLITHYPEHAILIDTAWTIAMTNGSFMICDQAKPSHNRTTSY